MNKPFQHLPLFCLLLIACEPPTQPMVGACWQNEVDYQTGTVFESQARWSKVSNDWNKQAPQGVDVLRMARGYQVYKDEKKYALELNNDKKAHCFIGCRISQLVDLETAIYAGWYKEQADLTDCQITSKMEPLDAEATSYGAIAGYNTGNSRNFCKQKCMSFLEF